MSSIVGTGGSDLASELMLNKIVNGTAKLENGNTLSPGLRSQAADLNRSAINASVASANVKTAIAEATAVQNFITEAKTYLENVQLSLKGASDDVAKEIYASVVNWMDHYTQQTVSGKEVFSGDSLYYDIGLDSYTTNVNSTNPSTTGSVSKDSLDIGSYSVLNSTINALKNVLETDGVSVEDVNKQLETSIETFYGALSASSLNIQTLENRGVLLDDLANTFSSSANGQHTNETTNAEGLLASLFT